MNILEKSLGNQKYMEKKVLEISFTKGSLKQTIPILGNKWIMFGKSPECDFKLVGEKISDFHFEISFTVDGKLLLWNLDHNLNTSFGLYKKLLLKEEFYLRPGSGLRIGSLEFHVERFNTGIVSEKGGW